MYAQICVDFKLRCVSVSVFDGNGKKVREESSCEIDHVEVVGTIRISLGERMAKDYLCFLAEGTQVFVERKGLIFKIR
jgi:hypothetical protein